MFGTQAALELERGWSRAVTHRQGRDKQDEEVQGHGHGHCRQQPGVQPGWHPQQRLVLRDAAKGTGCSSQVRTWAGPAVSTHPPHVELHLPN